MKATAAFVLDPDRCTGCEACRVACGIENNGGLDTGWRSLTTLNPARHSALPTRHLTLACNHCDTPACALGCPASAYDRDAATGAVLLDPAKCIGCRYCTWLCPYDAPRFDEASGVTTKCNFCAPRLAEGREPACAAACPTDALTVGERSGDGRPATGVETFPGLGEFGLGPALRVQPPRRASLPPAPPAPAFVGGPQQPLPPRKITPGGEWTLIAFTLLMPALVAWFAGGMARPSRAPFALAFLAIGGLAMALSTAHLGKPFRAWRAVLNVRSSWLSREVLFAGSFLVLGLPYLALPHASPSLGVPALVAGVLLCISIDAVYRAIPTERVWRVHDAEAVPTLALLTGIAASQPIVTWTAAALILVMTGVQPGRVRSIVRVVLLLAALVPSMPWVVAFLLALAGTAIDRVRFYDAIEPTSPARRMAAELVREARA